MSHPVPAAVMRHRPPALLLRAIEDFTGDALRCSGEGSGRWEWPDMLEGAAQAAGLLAGLQPGGPSNDAVIAEYRRVRLHAATHTGPLSFAARLDRRVLRFWRCRVQARTPAGAVLIDGEITVAPARAE